MRAAEKLTLPRSVALAEFTLLLSVAISAAEEDRMTTHTSFSLVTVFVNSLHLVFFHFIFPIFYLFFDYYCLMFFFIIIVFACFIFIFQFPPSRFSCRLCSGYYSTFRHLYLEKKTAGFVLDQSMYHNPSIN